MSFIFTAYNLNKPFIKLANFFEKLRRDFKLPPRKHHTSLVGGTLKLVCAVLICFSFLFCVSCAHVSCFYYSEVFIILAFAVDDSLLFPVCSCQQLDRYDKTWKTRRAATFLAFIDVGMLQSHTPSSPIVMSFPVAYSSIDSSYSFTYWPLETFTTLSSCTLNVLLRVFVCKQ